MHPWNLQAGVRPAAGVLWEKEGMGGEVAGCEG